MNKKLKKNYIRDIYIISYLEVNMVNNLFFTVIHFLFHSF